MADVGAVALASTLARVTLCLFALGAYLALVRRLRYRRLQRLLETYATYARASAYQKMTFEEGQVILHHLVRYEFPFTFEKAIQFALFRTYGIPTISSLLLKTSLLSAPATASKRYADTVVLITDFITGDWGGNRWLESLSRVNCIHEPYRTAGKISNDDMLYTLSLFALEPIRWTSLYEWRVMTNLERCAIGVFWKGIGDGMEMSYEGLPSSKGDQGWRDGLHWLEELSQWTEAYEVTNMIAKTSNHEVAEQTTAILLWTLPQSLKSLGKHAVGALMDARLRTAMMYPDPPAVMLMLMPGILKLRRIALKYLALPRPDFWPYRTVTDKPDKKGCYHLLKYDSLPYYVKPTAWNRWLTPGSWVSRLLGLPLPGDDGDKYAPDGYTPLACGPNHGKQRQKAMENRVDKVGRLKCPVGFGFK